MEGWLLGLAFVSEPFPDFPSPNQTAERGQGWSRWVNPASLSDGGDTGSPVLQQRRGGEVTEVLQCQDSSHTPLRKTFCLQGAPPCKEVLILAGNYLQLPSQLVTLWSPPELELSSVPRSRAVTVKTHCSFAFSVLHIELIIHLRGILQTHEGRSKVWNSPLLTNA